MVENNIEDLKIGDYILILNTGGSIKKWKKNILNGEIYEILEIENSGRDINAILNDQHYIRLHSRYSGAADYKSFYRKAYLHEIENLNTINDFFVFN